MSKPTPLDTRGLPAGYNFRPEWEVTPRDVQTLMRDRTRTTPIFVDCRRPDEHDVARIEGSVLIPMQDIERRADELEGEGGSRSHPLIVHCHHGARSLRVATTLRAMGFTDVRSMAGGIDLWSLDIDPGIPRY